MKQTLSLTDSELIAGFLGGQPRAFDLLMIRWHRQIYEFVFRYLGHPDDSHDIVQATFIRVYHNIHTLKDRDQFSSWPYRIALNMCHDHRRKRRLTPFSEMDAIREKTATSFADSVNNAETGHPPLKIKWGSLIERLLFCMACRRVQNYKS